jgi:hypothetical protein
MTLPHSFAPATDGRSPFYAQPSVAFPCCPTHDVRLSGGPIWWTCPTAHGVPAADLTREVTL